MKLLKHKLLVLFLLTSIPSWCQYPFFRNYTIENGLPSNKIYNLIEDRSGFIWVCTDQGVSRFDGVNFVNYNTNNGLPDNEILGIFEDNKGRIWFSSFNSEPSYYLDGKIYNASNDPFLKRVFTHKNDERNYTFIVQKNNSFAFLIEENKKRFIIGKDIEDIEIKYTDQVRSYLLQNILLENDQMYHVISRLEILKWHKGDSVKLDNNKIWGLTLNYFRAPGKYVYGLINKNNLSTVYKFDFKSGVHHQFKVDGKFIRIYDINNELILSTNQSYTRFNDSFTKVIEQVNLPFQFDLMYSDHKKNRWFCTSDHGIFFIHNNAPISVALKHPFDRGIISIENTHDFAALRTENNGLVELNLDGTTNIKYIDNEHKRIRGFGETDKNYVIGTDGGIVSFNKKFKAPQKICDQAVKDIEPFSNNKLLIATSNHCYIFNENVLVEIFNKRAYAICELADNTIWAGGFEGIYTISKSASGYTSNKLKLNPLIDKSRIVDIKKDKLGNVWIATDQRGVFFYSSKIGVERFSQNSNKSYNLLSDVCFQIQVAEDSSIWFSTQNGICKIRYTESGMLSDFKLQNYSLSEGIPGKIVNSVAFLKNKLLVATPNGVYVYDKYPFMDKELSNTIITGVKVNNTFYSSSELNLPYNENNIIISYSASFINTGGQYRFRYRVKGLNNNWVETNNLQVPLLGLESGDYSFEICSVNAQGDTGAIKKLNIHIKTPWFKQLWFIITISLILLFSIVYYWILLKDKIKLAQNLTLLRLRILRAQMNPHFIFNALSNIQQLIYLKELKSANTYIGTLSSIMRKSLDYSNKEFITLNKEIEYTVAYLNIEKLRFSDKFDYTIECSIDQRLQENIYVPPLLIQPLVENSIKHAFKGLQHKGQLLVKIEMLSENEIQYKIQDNGCGFDKSKYSPKDYGLGIANERVELLYKKMKIKGSFNVWSEANKGTVITINLPILRD